MSAGDHGTEDLVERGDIEGLVERVGSLCFDARWDDVVDLHDRCRAALQRGRQLWPAAAYAQYRLALDAPGRWAATVVDSTSGRFTHGPLPEVAASTHTWADLAPHLAVTPGAAAFAHERVVAGEDLRDDPVARALPPAIDLPLALEPWEPSYPVAEYRPDRAAFPAPPVPKLASWPLPEAPAVVRVHDPDACRALLDVPSAWTETSNGRADAVAVEGGAPGALRALGVRRARAAEVAPAVALAHLAWAGASGGAHGRRRGMAAGRFSAWWALATVAGLDEHWPIPGDELGEAAAELRWFLWDAGEPATGWALRLAVEDPQEGLAWAIAASDAG